MNRQEIQRNIFYSDRYYDGEYEYRHVVLPKEMVKLVPKTHLMTEDEWRSIGVQQSKGWIHYMTHSPDYGWSIKKLIITFHCLQKKTVLWKNLIMLEAKPQLLFFL
ncbi:cyclin-dependent kinases regulatory subunit-like isoform X1 [Leptinotarsa decemlineata]|uniref:cyclin-dependent kinases regulatory subunit-like isoform X1 n=1 Tax=Leptinotarsa decemlineata TaxID=7539 RepID=UPI003D30CBAE